MEILFQSLTVVLILLMCVWFAMCIHNEITKSRQLKRLDEIVDMTFATTEAKYLGLLKELRGEKEERR